MSLIVQRLKEYIEFKGLAVSVAEKTAGVSNGGLSKPFKANTAIKTDTLEKFLNKYNEINPVWLLTGNGSMLKKESNSVITNGVITDQSNYKDLAEARLQIIEMKDEKILRLEKDLSEFRYNSQKEPVLYRTVAEPAPELIKKHNK